MIDILVIGGGINGAGIARDAAGRGLATMLVEKDDLAQHTSSASTKLVHGGLRYLEHREFRLVRESLREREILLAAAPHIVWPLRFVLPYEEGMRPRWLLRLGLALYDTIGGRRSLPGTHSVKLETGAFGAPLQDHLRRGFTYSDCWVEDARLVVLTALDAAERGAAIHTRTRCVALERIRDHWIATLQCADGSEMQVETRAIVNAAGPWVDIVGTMAGGSEPQNRLRKVKGSHIVVPRLHDGDHAYVFQNPDGRIAFAIPYERAFTLIGTTDVAYDGDPDHPEITPEEIAYLCGAVSEYFRRPVSPDHVVSTFTGIRPLYDDGAGDDSKVTRDYVLDLHSEGGAPILSVYGGKITTYRKLAESALERLGAAIPLQGQSWTATAALPGGNLPGGSFEGFVADAQARYRWMGPAMLRRLARAYGNRMHRWLSGARGMADLGRRLGGDLYAAELAYMVEHEFARTAEDALWRRSKLGMHLPPEAIAEIEQWFASNVPQPAESGASGNGSPRA